MSGHTPGPWVLRYPHIDAPGGQGIAEVFYAVLR